MQEYIHCLDLDKGYKKHKLAEYEWLASNLTNVPVAMKCQINSQKSQILTQLPFAVEMWAQIGPITNTARQKTCGMLPVQLQQWHPSQWQD